MLGRGARYSKNCITHIGKSLQLEVCIEAYNCALRHATRVKFLDLGERRTGYRLAFKAKAYDLLEWRYEQFCIKSSLLLCREVCYPG